VLSLKRDKISRVEKIGGRGTEKRGGGRVMAVKGYKRELHTGTNKIMMCQYPIAC